MQSKNAGRHRADSTVISSNIRTQLCKPQLDGKIRHLGDYDGHQLTLLGSLNSDVEWNGSRLTQKHLAVVQSNKEFGLLGRDILPKHGMKNITTKHLPAVKDYKAHVKLIPGSQPMFCKARKKPLPLQEKSKRSWNRWSDGTSLNRYSQESLMHLQWCGREIREEN